MSDNVGLSTPRGSGTSGYVQRNLAHFRPRDLGAPYPKDLDSLRHRQRQPDKEILEHDRKRDVEVKVFDLRDQLEDEGYASPRPPPWPPLSPDPSPCCTPVRDKLTRLCSLDEEEIDKRCDALRKKLLDEMARGKVGTKKSFKSHEVHEMADAKIKESERLRNALGIRKDYEEGSHWKRQEERLRTALEKETKTDDKEEA